MINTLQKYNISIMLYNYENGIKMMVQGAYSIYTFSPLTTYNHEVIFNDALIIVLKFSKLHKILKSIDFQEKSY